MLVKLRFFDCHGEVIDEVTIYKSGNCSGIPKNTQWVEVVYELA